MYQLIVSEEDVKEFMEMLDSALKRDGLLVLTKVVNLFNVLNNAKPVEIHEVKDEHVVGEG
jgi:hypothetical protein